MGPLPSQRLVSTGELFKNVGTPYLVRYSGSDGSLQVSMTVDETGTGQKFVAGTVSKNGAAVRSCAYLL